MASFRPPTTSNPDPHDPKDNEATYHQMTALEIGEDNVGARCQASFCGQLDFLPFRCASCHGQFCADHRTEDGHRCPQKGAWAAARRAQQNGVSSDPNARSSPKPTVLNSDQCSAPTCKTLINTPLSQGVRCASCKRSYCLKHRMGEDHDCAKLTAAAAPSAQRLRGLAALEKLKAWGAAKQKTLAGATMSKSKSAAAAQLTAINTLKKQAKGDAKIPVTSRVYLHVEAEATTTSAKVPRGEFFYSGDWSVGRVLDVAAKALQVPNLNNRGGGEEEKLRVFHVEGGRLLEYSEKLKEKVATGDTIVLLRGVGPAVPDLIQV